MSIWRRDHDQFIYTSMFLSELESEYWHEVYTSGNIRALAIYIRGTISPLVSRSKELVIDATFGTNSSGMALTAVLAELDGTGIPLCYLFSGVSTTQVSKLEDSGSTTLILEEFLQPLKAAGFDPIFFGCDKDRAEISAIKQVWPDTTVQLCYWHAKRAIRKKLSDPKKTATQRHYFPHEAKALVPALEICRGSYPTRRPDDDHRYGLCQCPSSSEVLVKFGRVETNGITKRNIVLAMFSRHFNMHSMIPDQNGTYRSAEMTHSDCINELYTWCRARNYFCLWAFLFVNWYAPVHRKLWTRSSNPERLPVLKTTMIIESH
ncbi:hypothetical protein K3495_g7484 [Podosphaera aphanis]|nr:hypothetical protein K3495_g7484 [Podosphaera aphanis]